MSLYAPEDELLEFRMQVLEIQKNCSAQYLPNCGGVIFFAANFPWAPYNDKDGEVINKDLQFVMNLCKSTKNL